MEVKESKLSFNERMKILKTKVIHVFIKKKEVSSKTELNTKSLKIIGITFILIFITVAMLMPNEQPVEFLEKIQETPSSNTTQKDTKAETSEASASNLWAAPRPNTYGTGGMGGGSQINYNTSTILGSKNGNAKTQLRAGLRLPLRIIDKFIVSQDPVPILAELILNSKTESGLMLPAGTKFYGEASFQKGAERATVQFKQISLPNGDIRPITGIAVGKDGQPGLPGKIYSDGLKNTTGQVLTTFIGGLAAGSVQTDVFGRSRGGLENGMLTAVAATAKDRAQAYGEKLKAEREWIEVGAGSEGDALLSDSLNLQMDNTQ